ncbi:MAG: squalene/phytoene synthase family protein [Verrucomicrobiota bacterium]
MSAASEITRKAESNLAFALKILPKDRREDMVIFYAFCRTVDDIADELGVSVARRAEGLKAWEDGIHHGFPAEHELGNELMEMTERRGISSQWLLEIIEGCRMDLQPQKFGSWEALAKYNWKVAGVVGLVSTRIFGCVHESSDRYAEMLGNALQLTNILRDVGEDLANGGRIYLPENDIIRFQYSERDLIGRVYDGRFIAMMRYQAERAKYLFREAEALIHPMDRHALLPARAMAEIYQCLLEKMKEGGFKVFHQRYSVSKARKVLILLKFLFADAIRSE